MDIKKADGFSLIEASVSLLVVGIVSCICMTQLSSFMNINKIQQTQKHYEVVVNSLGAYFIATNGSLPAPININENGFGTVPFKTLGIMEKFAKDGNGKLFLYKLNPYFGKPTTNPNHINLGISEFTSSYEDKIAFILASVDSKGHEIYKIWYSERNFKAMFPIRNENVDIPENSTTQEFTSDNDILDDL